MRHRVPYVLYTSRSPRSASVHLRCCAALLSTCGSCSRCRQVRGPFCSLTPRDAPVSARRRDACAAASCAPSQTGANCILSLFSRSHQSPPRRFSFVVALVVEAPMTSRRSRLARWVRAACPLLPVPDREVFLRVLSAARLPARSAEGRHGLHNAGSRTFLAAVAR